MKMSVFLQGQDVVQLEHLAVIREATDPDYSAMVMHAWMQDATVLVGLKTGTAVVKNTTEGDDQLSFEALYDTAISLSQWKRMEEQKVASPEELAPHVYELNVALEMARPVFVRLRIQAKHTTEVKTILNRLIRGDKEFQDSLMNRLTQALLDQDDGTIITTAVVLVDTAAPAEMPLWEFQDPD
jgi:hypothetical protein